MFKSKIHTSALALVALGATAPAAFAQDGEDFIAKYRAQGGMLAVEGEPATEADEVASSARALLDRLATGREASEEKIEGFNQAVDTAFPMTPEMIRRYKEIQEESQRALLETVEPEGKSSTTLVSLQPGEPAPMIKVSPKIASVIGFYDATGAAWPISRFVLGDSSTFTAVALEENANNIVLTPNQKIGFTNIIVKLEGLERPVSVRINVDKEIVDSRYDVQVMHMGPNAQMNNASGATVINEAGEGLLLKALSGVKMPANARRVAVEGVTSAVDAIAWLVGDRLIIRTTHSLISPGSIGGLSGAGGVRVYEINPVSMALFSVDGQIIKAQIKLP